MVDRTYSTHTADSWKTEANLHEENMKAKDYMRNPGIDGV